MSGTQFFSTVTELAGLPALQCEERLHFPQNSTILLVVEAPEFRVKKDLETFQPGLLLL